MQPLVDVLPLIFLSYFFSAGLLNGNVGVLKSSLAELTDHTNEARAFALLPVSWTAGAALGPILGGYLANPAKRYPDLFGDSTFLKQYKYFLPCFTGALFPIIGVISSIIFLKEASDSLGFSRCAGG